MSTAEASTPNLSSSYAAGLIAGLVNAAGFNWYDKGLYEAIKHKRPFLSWKNFQNPWQGFHAAVAGRILSYGFWFPLADSFGTFYTDKLDPDHFHPDLVRVIASQSTSAVLCVPLAPISSVKYRMWGSNHGYLAISKSMWRTGGVACFFHGVAPTLCRDGTWAATFSLTRHRALAWSRESSLNPTERQVVEFSLVTAAGGAATILSSPFNYARNAVYSCHPPATPPTTWAALRILAREVASHQTPIHFLQQRLGVGWGTLRVAVGMSVSSSVYEASKRLLDR
mmetsp:Transcript_55554/g.104235  ORF Transcript_55554/g.104235 Transcript_55554/m.104235 type:complete len:282 (+) Transcript_55554:116-961(+)|eukprot:CAMPEP_0171862842 /NCGR_PEP_ID=MMETSP0992-20121227/27916_1 /TAXON_ID=483369 /ORGANISM="non described non described, Strain CCMP2098" /LENGTH=281 /DNA_ID=CAMNT_0012485127 /DNA_START=96 /DNA_END=941 /DNA_ORIENTATION=-